MGKHEGDQGGRPKIELDFKLLENLCAIQCTESEIEAVMEVSVDTIDRRLMEVYGIGFADYSRQKKGKGKMSLRRRQIQAALAGDKTLLIWLGKQYLDQADQHVVKGNLTHTLYDGKSTEELEKEAGKLGDLLEN